MAEFDIDDYEAQHEKSTFRKWVPYITGGVLVLGVGGVVALVMEIMSSTPPPQEKVIQQISLVQPPPPPPPPKIEEPPPQEEIEEIEEIEEPEMPDEAAEDLADDTSLADDLGLDADGVAGSDGFGLKAKKGGRGLLGGGHRFGRYAGIIKNDVQKLLSGVDEVRKDKYTIVVEIWIAPTGRIDRADLVNTTGDVALDESLRRALGRSLRVSEAPPEDMPQPVKLRISSSG